MTNEERDRRRKDRLTTPWLARQNKEAQIEQNKRIWRLEHPYQPRRKPDKPYVKDVLDR